MVLTFSLFILLQAIKSFLDEGMSSSSICLDGREQCFIYMQYRSLFLALLVNKLMKAGVTLGFELFEV